MDKTARQRAYDKGLVSEEIAVNLLKRSGLEVLAQRYKTKFGEIDIVARSADTLVFVEVKARGSFSEGAEAVNYRTRRRIEQAALYFITQHQDYADFGMRFDVIVVSSGGMSVDYLDNAWMAGE